MEPSDDSPEPVETPAPPSRRESLVPALAVTAVAVVAVVAAVMVKRADTEAPMQAAALAPAGPVPAQRGEVVKAPPLQSPETRAMGGAAACRDCGVVEMVVAVREPGRKEPSAYQMHVRMDDGSRRMIEQRGALAAGSRVVLEGGAIKPMP